MAQQDETPATPRTFPRQDKKRPGTWLIDGVNIILYEASRHQDLVDCGFFQETPRQNHPEAPETTHGPG